ncbi:hypothetical protein RhiirC2_776897 [Rhizophagus irregularis]|uniref:Uncharacterized protein n=1 Tax=Rhizophagus irregularis TaxID=588596 RepID=A0A2N1NFJ0_9GLOM|nr:hypothetical protein RhiirC2_776897 [Rhizophagus irregularis]
MNGSGGLLTFGKRETKIRFGLASDFWKSGTKIHKSRMSRMSSEERKKPKIQITTEKSIIICLKQKQIKCQGEDFIRNVLQDILGVTAKSKKLQKFQHLALEVKVETYLTTKLQKDFKISLTEAQMLMANILIRLILIFKELLWKPRYEQVILWEKRKGIT